MVKKSTLLKLQVLFFITLLIVNNKTIAQVTTLTEGFDDFSATGWITVNNSTNASTGQTWSQGDRQLNAYTGGKSSYAYADYHSVGGSAEGTISNWLISPELNLANGGAITFYTRTFPSDYADRLQVRLSRNGASKNVGSSPAGVGSFTELLLTINPTLDLPDENDEGGYPDSGWTQYTISVPPGGTSGRVAFRYFVADGGSSGTNSNYIGIDQFSYESVLPVTLFNFRGEIKNNQALLTWSTANEINNKGFEVEQSHDNKAFSSIGFVAAVKTSTGVNNYSFINSELLSGANYYRLKQVDNDGASRYSSVVKLDYSKFAWAIFGNPSNNTFIQLQTEAQSNVAIQIVSLNGQLIQTIRKGNLSQGTYNIPLNLTNAPHGIYIVRLLVDKNSYTKKLIK
jgi:hypothetical protein